MNWNWRGKIAAHLVAMAQRVDPELSILANCQVRFRHTAIAHRPHTPDTIADDVIQPLGRHMLVTDNSFVPWTKERSEADVNR